MKRVILFGICCLLPVAAGLAAESSVEKASDEPMDKPAVFKPVRDGASFKDVVGVVEFDAEEGRWFFAGETDISDVSGKIAAGTKTEMLRCNTLERIVKSGDGQRRILVRLEGTMTFYKGKNYIYATEFTPLKQLKEAKPADDAGQDSEEQPQAEAGDDQQPDSEKATDKEPESILPGKVRQKLDPKRGPDLKKVRRDLGAKTDVLLVRRTGFIEKHKAAKGKAEYYTLRLDSLGRRLSKDVYEILPSRELGAAVDRQGRNIGRTRFSVMGIVTVFDGKKYLLLQRAVPIMNNGNFAR